MKIEQTRLFARAVRKLHRNQKKDLDKAVRQIMAEPEIGQQKQGDLLQFRVHKFRMNKQLTLLAYSVNGRRIMLHALGSHENFYRDLKH